MKNPIKHFVVILLVLIFNIYSCSSDPNDTKQKLTVQTGKSSYANNDTIRFTVKNYNSVTAHLASCCTSIAYYIDKNENGVWVEHSNLGLPCLALCPGIDLTISYLEVRGDDVFLHESGTFRLRIPYSFNQGQNWTDEIVSNAFTIE
jgi:hypothetical protein